MELFRGDVVSNNDYPSRGGEVQPLKGVRGESLSTRGSHDELDLIGLWLTLWEGRWLILASTIFVTIGAVGYALNATEWYRAEVLLLPAEKKSVGLSGQLGSLGGLASLAGISVGDGGTAEPLAVLTSRDFTKSFIQDENLMPALFPEKWDATTKQWKSKEASGQPDIRDGVKLFGDKVRGVREDRKTGLITVSVKWTDSAVAAQWANELVARINSHMRQKALKDAQANVEYLQRELDGATVLALQQSIGRLLEAELQKVMLAKGNEEFAFRVIDRADQPRLRESPKRGQIVAIGFFAGGLLGLFAAYFHRALKRARVRN